MATVLSQQLSNDVSSTSRRNYPIDDYGKLRISYFYYKNTTGAVLAADTEIDLCDLPPGRVRILPFLSRYRSTALGASRILDIGHREYYPSNNPGTAEAEDDDAFVDGKDVSAAVNDVAFDGGATKMKFDMYSRVAKRMFATVNGGNIPVDAVIEGFFVYVVE